MGAGQNSNWLSLPFFSCPGDPPWETMTAPSDCPSVPGWTYDGTTVHPVTHRRPAEAIDSRGEIFILSNLLKEMALASPDSVTNSAPPEWGPWAEWAAYGSCARFFEEGLFGKALSRVRVAAADGGLTTNQQRLGKVFERVKHYRWCDENARRQDGALLLGDYNPDDRTITFFSRACWTQNVYGYPMGAWSRFHRGLFVLAHELGHVLDDEVGDYSRAADGREERATAYAIPYIKCFDELVMRSYERAAREVVSMDNRALPDQGQQDVAAKNFMCNRDRLAEITLELTNLERPSPESHGALFEIGRSAGCVEGGTTGGER